MERPRDEKIRVVTRGEMEEVRRLLARADARKESPLKGMRGALCSVCNRPTVDYAEDMTYESYGHGERVVITGLTGMRCRSCGDQGYDLRSSGIIERVLEERVPGGYECTITTLGGERLGIYLPKDVVRELDLERGRKAVIKLLTRRRMVIEV
jgi:hypothetical protein